MKQFLGLDIGGTKIAAVLVNDRMKVIKQIQRPTEAHLGKKKVLENIVSCIKELKTSQVRAIGVGVAGFADSSGKLVFLGNLPLKNVNLQDHVKKKFRCKVLVENDANCFALAEAVLGAGKAHKNVLAVTLGTGVGGGIVFDRQLYLGRGAAAEFGHMVLDSDGPRDRKGHKADFEALCSGANLVKAYYRNGGKQEDMLVKDMLGSKEKAAKKTMDQFFSYAGRALANLVHVLNPDIIIVGGALSSLKIYKRLNQELQKQSLQNSLTKVKVVKNKLGESSGFLGAALLVCKKR